jgi:hypothetical protein
MVFFFHLKIKLQEVGMIISLYVNMVYDRTLCRRLIHVAGPT